MSIIDYEIRKQLEEAWLLEMAIEQKKAKKLCEGNSFPFIIHLCKCFLFRDTIWYDHWLKEASSFCSRLDDLWLKPNRKKPDKNFFLDYFVDEIEEANDAKLYLNFAIDRCPEIERNEATNNECFIFLDLFEDLRYRLADYLSDETIHDNSDYYQLIDSVIKEYPIVEE